MNVLIIGSGGREHALALAVADSTKCTQVIVGPGNPGMLTNEKISIREIEDDELISFVHSQMIDLVVIGPEAPLAQGLSDQLRSHNIKVFGPSKSAARLEASKIFCKQILAGAKIKTADFLFSSDLEGIEKAIQNLTDDKGVVLKADGLASGKGVMVCKNTFEANQAAKQLLHKYPGQILVESLLKGREVSAMYLCNGTDYIALGEACDHKRLLDNDEGPNTGGMGAYSPVPWLNKKLQGRIASEVIEPTLKQMQKIGCPFTGLLFAGLMIDGDDINVLEFNVRFGDPETQTLLPRLNWDALEALYAVACGDDMAFKKLKITQKKMSCVHVVKASAGYPEKPVLGDEITLINSPQVYFAGVKTEGLKLVTSGGRVLGVTGVSETIEQARTKAYELLNKANFTGSQFRSDIGRNI